MRSGDRLSLGRATSTETVCTGPRLTFAPRGRDTRHRVSCVQMRRCLIMRKSHPLADSPSVAATLNVLPLEAKTRSARGRPLLAYYGRRRYDCGSPSVPAVPFKPRQVYMPALQIPKGCCHFGERIVNTLEVDPGTSGALQPCRVTV